MKKNTSSRRFSGPWPVARFFILADSCMRLVTPPGWKVLSYIARQNLETLYNEWESRYSPIALITRDLTRATGIPLSEPQPSPALGPHLLEADSSEPKEQFVPISFAEFCRGSRKPNGTYRNFGTGLSKSAVVKAIHELLQLGVIERRRRHAGTGGDMSTLYRIAWSRVEELTKQLDTTRKNLTFKCTPQQHPRVRKTDSGVSAKRTQDTKAERPSPLGATALEGQP